MAPVRWVMTNVVVRQAAASFTYPLSTFASLHPCPPESGGRNHSKTPASPHSRNGSAGQAPGASSDDASSVRCEHNSSSAGSSDDLMRGTGINAWLLRYIIVAHWPVPDPR